ncbi:MAG TPA: PadR family transcriptional regulator [Acidimicrobiales bacterium]|nr:PadR family transcriptional regulator [Acidimicrobiales bacterium]HWI04704.1 PadR family transcriptional regulator [Acidimicrobiales bacterium]
MPTLTTTSYAILSLLAVRPWTTYELSQQMERSVGAMWPRAASVVYEEPKRLVQQRLAAAETKYTGRRASTVYSITAKGRRALAAWLATPGDSPSIEHEALLKVAFADQGSLEGLRANLTAIREYAEGELAYGERRRREYADTGGPFPERLPVIALAMRYFEERNLALLRWVEWAEEATAGWTGVAVGSGAAVPPGAFAPSTGTGDPVRGA